MKIIPPTPTEYSPTDTALHHITKIGQYLQHCSQRPVFWDRLCLTEQQHWTNNASEKIGAVMEALNRLQMALYFSTAVLTDKTGTSRRCEDKVAAILEALVPISEDYLAVDISRQPSKPYNPMLKGQQICLNCQHWNSKEWNGSCTVRSQVQTQATHSCSSFQQYIPDESGL